MRDFWHFLVGGMVGCFCMALCMMPYSTKVTQERDELRDAMRQVRVDLGDHRIMVDIDWDDLLNKD